jgi:hypothetical protein
MSLKEQGLVRAYQYDQKRKYENMFREDGLGFF